jgi:hypothetical protein
VGRGAGPGCVAHAAARGERAQERPVKRKSPLYMVLALKHVLYKNDGSSTTRCDKVYVRGL